MTLLPITRTAPDGFRLFRVVWVTSVAAGAFGSVVLLALWALADFDADVGATCTHCGAVLWVMLALGSVTHYPCSRSWCQGLGSSYPDRNA